MPRKIYIHTYTAIFNPHKIAVHQNLGLVAKCAFGTTSNLQNPRHNMAYLFAVVGIGIYCPVAAVLETVFG